MTEKTKVLIVDDNELLVRNVRDIFAANGYHADMAMTGNAALDMCRKTNYGLALLDIKLPDINGDELAGLAREIIPDLEIIIMTGNASIETAIRAVGEAGIAAYETKPLNMDRLLSLSREITSRKRAQKALRFYHRTLEIANSHTHIKPLLDEFVQDVQSLTGCDAVGIRILGKNGEIPYLSYSGFDEVFYEKESPLSILNDNCMCIEVVKGNTDSSKPFFTPHGSFYINATTKFLATVSEEEKGSTRNECNRWGYETVALVPLKSMGRVLGLIHIADKREGFAPLETVEALEQAAMQLSAAIQRIQAEEELLASKEYAEELIKTANVLVVEIDLQGIVVDINSTCEKILGYSREELVGKNWFDMIAPIEKFAYVYEAFRAFIEGGGSEEMASMENPVITKDGDERYIVWRTNSVRDNGAITGLVSFGIDITQRKNHEEKIRALSQRVFEMQEEERSKLSRELHDELGQQLTALRLELEWIKKQPPEKLNEESFNMLIGMVESSMGEVRRICRGLRPTILDDLGLCAAMEALAREFALVDIFEIEYNSVSIESYEINPETAICVFRVMQEALNNAAKHSAAKKVTIEFRRKNGDFELEIVDDGCGFSDETLVGKQGFGIIGMSERAALCGGAVTVRSEIGGGTRVVMNVPKWNSREESSDD